MFDKNFDRSIKFLDALEVCAFIDPIRFRLSFHLIYCWLYVERLLNNLRVGEASIIEHFNEYLLVKVTIFCCKNFQYFLGVIIQAIFSLDGLIMNFIWCVIDLSWTILIFRLVILSLMQVGWSLLMLALLNCLQLT
jgi:hypothetical protein